MFYFNCCSLTLATRLQVFQYIFYVQVQAVPTQGLQLECIPFVPFVTASQVVFYDFHNDVLQVLLSLNELI